MFPAVPPPDDIVGRSVDFKLRPGWRYDESNGAFVDAKGAEFAAPALPKRSRILCKVPALANAAPEGLSKAEQDLQRYMQVIVPSSRSTQGVLKVVQSWPCVEEAHLTPVISLPVEKYRGGRSKRS